MRHREVDVAGSDTFGVGCGSSREAHAWLRAPDDLDLLPREPHAAAERLADRFLAGKPTGVALRRPGARVAVLALGVGEAALPEARAFERPLDALDLDDVDSNLQTFLHHDYPSIAGCRRPQAKDAGSALTDVRARPRTLAWGRRDRISTWLIVMQGGLQPSRRPGLLRGVPGTARSTRRRCPATGLRSRGPRVGTCQSVRVPSSSRRAARRERPPRRRPSRATSARAPRRARPARRRSRTGSAFRAPSRRRRSEEHTS